MAAVRSWRQRHPGYLGPKRKALADKVKTIKEETPCADCKQKFPACCMDFDHQRGGKHSEVGSLVGRTSPWEMIEAEIAKCDVVCANCHRIRTRDRGVGGWTRSTTIEKDEEPKGTQRS